MSAPSGNSSSPRPSNANHLKKLAGAPLAVFVKSFPACHFIGTAFDVTTASVSGDWMLENDFVIVSESSWRYSLASKVKTKSTSFGSLGSRVTLSEVKCPSNWNRILKGAYLKVFDVGRCKRLLKEHLKLSISFVLE